MSSTSTPQSASGYASPIPTSTPVSKQLPPKAKPTNVFSNDGSFLERFQRTTKEEEEKKKEQDALEKLKRNFDNRFKNRGKRTLPDSTLNSEPALDNIPAKRMKSDDNPNYQRELKTLDGRALKVLGTGVRPLVR